MHLLASVGLLKNMSLVSDAEITEFFLAQAGLKARKSRIACFLVQSGGTKSVFTAW
ncbi:hypothetical protein [Marinobacter similis]|uniref:hypothetical protein n=1 Tax=Marinobacter similis TaxID=1420916 RepID=UPI00130EBD9F|nr:hypothetical protein [Marinobacter similis]